MSAVPGPRDRFPLDGFFSFWRDPTGSLVHLAERYGDVSRFRFGLYDEYLVTHPDHVQQILEMAIICHATVSAEESSQHP